MFRPMWAGSIAAGRSAVGILTSRLYPPPVYPCGVAVSLVPTQRAVETTCTPGAFGASSTVAASGPVEKPWWLSASRDQHGPFAPLPLAPLGSLVNGKTPSLNVFAVSFNTWEAVPRGSMMISTESASQCATHSAGVTAYDWKSSLMWT